MHKPTYPNYDVIDKKQKSKPFQFKKNWVLHLEMSKATKNAIGGDTLFMPDSIADVIRERLSYTKL